MKKVGFSKDQLTLGSSVSNILDEIREKTNEESAPASKNPFNRVPSIQRLQDVAIPEETQEYSHHT